VITLKILREGKCLGGFCFSQTGVVQTKKKSWVLISIGAVPRDTFSYHMQMQTSGMFCRYFLDLLNRALYYIGQGRDSMFEELIIDWEIILSVFRCSIIILSWNNYMTLKPDNLIARFPILKHANGFLTPRNVKVWTVFLSRTKVRLSEHRHATCIDAKDYHPYARNIVWSQVK
jgi:hypothetical protein